MKNKLINILLFTTIGVVFASTSLFSQYRLERVDFGPLNRVVLGFNDLPPRYSTVLSNDKKKININIPDCQVLESARSLVNNGIIKEIYTTINKRNINISVILSESRGYTCVALPYSKSLIIEVFNWNQLSADEEAYRTALLGLEDNIIESAKKDLITAVKAKNANAAAINGLLLLRLGKPNSALLNLRYAQKAGANISDIYAAMAQIYTLRGDLANARMYSDEFMRQSNLKIVPSIEIKELLEKDSSFSEPIDFLLELLKDSSIAKNDTVKKNDNTKADKRFDNLFNKDSVSQAEDGGILGLYKQFALYFIAIVAALALIILYLYLKWRNKQIQLISNAKTNKIKKPIKPEPKAKAQKETKESNPAAEKKVKAPVNKALEQYKKSSGEIFDKVIEDNEEEKFKPKKIEKKKIEKIEEDVIDSSIEETNLSKQEKSELDVVVAPNIESEEKPKSKAIPAKVELAMHLAQEQQRIRKETLENLNKTGISADKDKLIDMAKSLGIERGSIEAKSSLQKMQTDKETLMKLEQKFNVKK